MRESSGVKKKKDGESHVIEKIERKERERKKQKRVDQQQQLYYSVFLIKLERVRSPPTDRCWPINIYNRRF